MAKLGDICTVVSGSTPSSSVAEYWDGNHIWITPAELSDDSFIIYDSVRHITDKAIQETSLKPFPEGTVILSSRAPIGKTAIAGCKMYCNQGFKNLICSDSIYNKYLYFFLSSKTDYLNSLGRGATFKEISKHIVENIEISLPAIEEQKKRAAILEKLMGLIHIRKQQLSKLDQLVKSRFVEMFGDKTNTTFPKCKMREIASIKHGFPFSGEFFTEKDNNILLVTPGNFKIGGGFQEKKCKFFTGDYPEDYILHHGDLIVTMTDLSKNMDTLGYPAIVPFSQRTYLHNQRIGRFVDISKNINTIFLMYFMKTNEYRNKIISSATGSTVHHTSPSKILNCDVFIPPIDLQETFAAFVKQLDKTKSSVEQSLEKLETLKKSLLQEYFG